MLTIEDASLLADYIAHKELITALQETINNLQAQLDQANAELAEIMKRR